MTDPRRDVALIAGPGGDTCLDYANTLSWRGRAAPVETLGDARDLLRWLVGAAGLASEMVAEMEGRARADPVRAARLLAEAIALRESIYRIFAALACGDAAADRDLATLNRALAAAPPRRRIARVAAGHAWQVGPLALSAPRLLAPVLWSAGDLLVSERRRRVRLCANEECRWLFLDESKAGTRRWCDMASCGNRAKARRHYQRSKRVRSA